MAPAVARHPEQQFLLFPGEGRGMHTHTNTHTQLIKQQNVHIFLSLYFFFPMSIFNCCSIKKKRSLKKEIRMIYWREVP